MSCSSMTHVPPLWGGMGGRGGVVARKAITKLHRYPFPKWNTISRDRFTKSAIRYRAVFVKLYGIGYSCACVCAHRINRLSFAVWIKQIFDYLRARDANVTEHLYINRCEYIRNSSLFPSSETLSTNFVPISIVLLP